MYISECLRYCGGAFHSCATSPRATNRASSPEPFAAPRAPTVSAGRAIQSHLTADELLAVTGPRGGSNGSSVLHLGKALHGSCQRSAEVCLLSASC